MIIRSRVLLFVGPRRPKWAPKARGVKFGRPPKPVPDNFYQVHRDWRNKKLTLQQAADACAMPVTTFYEKAVQFEKVN